ELVVRAPGGLQVAPGPSRPAGVDTGEGVEHVALVRRTREPALLELAAHRDQGLRSGRDVLAGGAPPPGVRAGAAVGEDPPREHDAVLALRPQLRERSERIVVRRVPLR